MTQGLEGMVLTDCTGVSPQLALAAVTAGKCVVG